MQKSYQNKIQSLFPAAKFDELLKNHCTFRIGGPTDIFIEINSFNPESLANFKSLLKFLHQNRIPFFILGGGANVLFHDKGFRGVVIKISACEFEFKIANPNSITGSNQFLYAEAGASLQYLISKASGKGFYHLLRLSGIPGTLGGAIRGNAGANGLEIKDILVDATILDPKTGQIKKVPNKFFKFSYRHSILKTRKYSDHIVLSATLLLTTSPEEKLLLSKIKSSRKETQPWGLSAGSFFKNPDSTDSLKKTQSPKPQSLKTKFATPPADIPLKAGFLIDQCGLKGKRIGGAIISEKHANFIQNLNDPKCPATQKDVLDLASKAKKSVFKKFKIRLEEEVKIVPERLK